MVLWSISDYNYYILGMTSGQFWPQDECESIAMDQNCGL